MDEHVDIIFWVLGIIGFVYGGVLVWLVKRLLGSEGRSRDSVHDVVTGVAVLDQSQKALRREWERAEKRNTDTHTQIITQMKDNHGIVMTRLDRVIEVVKNGG